MTGTFIVCWDCLGLECVISVTEVEQDNIIAILSGKPTNKSVNAMLNLMLLRASYNTHRFYEIYGITAVDGISQEDIEEMFENSPQEAAETIRQKGQKIYSARPDKSKIKIT